MNIAEGKKLENEITEIFRNKGWETAGAGIQAPRGAAGFDIVLCKDGKRVGAVETKLYRSGSKPKESVLQQIARRFLPEIGPGKLSFCMAFVNKEAYLFTNIGFKRTEVIPSPKTDDGFALLATSETESEFGKLMYLVQKLDRIYNPQKEDLVFISYKSDERPKAVQTVSFLQSNGFSCWIDRTGIKSGQHFTEEIAAAIKDCLAVVFMMSRLSLSSEQCMIEIDKAIAEGKRIIPYKIDDSLTDGDIPEKILYFQFAETEQRVLEGLTEIRKRKIIN